ncbi:bifunctional transcriptional activator/DNA repair enzyme AdaA [Thalassococcus sp. S3]|uniref:bifunctional transcriptional activator/DNA repair enzyme AdaA n=1 Tax=Thalassococcus sp. S3 TaxID=2017482 RepID=UPI0010247655|nr:trifunctional transcriptional activator/DNA repair protein Ada/methylated-DNA--[protein]-cysteine S-methyltransferase [Thalassococcus sp. S3]QBF32118.1 bifunctional transcriptional activator/DNA repair enzyme protein Ada [Thalassococcus sp. S3]
MLTDLPDDTTLYDALLRRDAAFDGRVYVAVATTGIFCRLTCPARKPRKENCAFYRDVAACIAAGYRPCKRCRPLRPEADADPVIKDLLEQLERRPTHRWSEADVAASGYDPSTVRRAFKRHFGMTFLELARQNRLRDGFVTLAEGGDVIDAQIEAGFASPSAFRDAFARLLGRAPGRFSRTALLRADWIDTPLGAMIAVSDASALHLLEFVERKALPSELKRLEQAAKGQIGLGRYAPTDQITQELDAFFAGRDARFQTPLVLHGTPFTRDVWTRLRQIPAGETRSYSQIAAALGRPDATRAVARANGANQIALVIPCHRVLGADGALTGYGGGLWRKQRLLEIESMYARPEDRT